jgi:glycosyltransferase involved in cell wall biosynthesis
MRKPPVLDDVVSPVALYNIDLADLGTAPLRLATPYHCVIWRGGRAVGVLRNFAQQGSVDDLTRACQQLAAAEPPAPSAGPSRSATVVICTRDRAGELNRCLGSFRDQTRSPDQVVVVDNASIGDETRQVALSHGVTYVREPRPGLDFARNTGAAAASGDIVAYTDDDTVLHPAWLEELIAAFDHPDIWAVTGLVLPAELETPAQCVFEKAWGFGKGFERRDFGPEFYAATRRLGCPAWDVGAGANMAFRRDVFERVGGFDDRLDVGAAGCSGDSEYWHRILHAGGVCRYEPRAIVHHFHRREFSGLRQQIRAYMRGHVAALLVQYERTGEKGNVRRLLRSMPKWYARQVLRRLGGRRDASTCMLDEEIRGYLEGVVYFARAPKPGAPARLAHSGSISR